MKPGAEIILEITDVAYGGAGLGRHEGRVVFVPFTIPGEKVRARVARVHRSYLAADAVAVENPSPDRVEPPCPLFRRCGGCAYQHIAYARQLEIKTRQVADALRRIGKIAEPPVEAARPSPREYGYRNRITVHVEPPAIGFRGTDPRRVINVERCLLAEDEVNAKLARLRSKRHLRPGPATLRTGDPGGGFKQVNDAAAEVLASVAAEMAGNGDALVDAYCGAGFFAKAMRGAFARVVGIDWDERSIEAARANAQPGEEYIAGDTAAVLPEVLAKEPGAVVLLDPPAQGVAAEVVQTLLLAAPPRLVYISCDPPTLARDIAKLSASYALTRAVPVDMFPQTASIETAALLERRL